MKVRTARLQAEYLTMQQFRSQVLTWKTVGNNNPPDWYHLSYNLKSITGFTANRKPQYHTGFKVEVRFSPDFPRKAPEVRLLDKPWPLHPNIWGDGRFCLEGTQSWIRGIGVPLDSICLLVGEIIAFQEVYLASPANSDTVLTQWVRKKLKIEGTSKVVNPVDASPIRLPDLEDIIVWGDKNSRSKPPDSSRIQFG